MAPAPAEVVAAGAAEAEVEAEVEAEEEEEWEVAEVAEAAAAEKEEAAAGVSGAAAVWEVLLAGRFEPYDEVDSAAIESAFARGAASVPVRCGTRAVRLDAVPFVQGAAVGQPACKEREVRRVSRQP